MNTETVRVRVPAKINLSLHVGPKGADGYHQLSTLFQAVSLFDDISATRDEPGVFSLKITGEYLEVTEDNLAIKAAKLLAAEYGNPSCGVQLKIKKRIPVAGGMAGGSADAAGTLLACAVLWDLDTAPDDLAAIGAKLGADVPFALLGGSAIGTRRGDQVVPVICRGSYSWVLALSPQGLATPKVYHKFDQLNNAKLRPVNEELLAALAAGEVTKVGHFLSNDLESAALKLQPQLRETLDAGINAGALGAIVSGSGPTCAFLVDSDSAALRIADELATLENVRAVHRASGPVTGAHLLI